MSVSCRFCGQLQEASDSKCLLNIDREQPFHEWVNEAGELTEPLEPTTSNERQIEVTESDELIIPLKQVEEVIPGVFRITPNKTLRERAKRQGAIKIV